MKTNQGLRRLKTISASTIFACLLAVAAGTASAEKIVNPAFQADDIPFLPASTEEYTIPGLSLQGEIEGENVTFTLEFTANVESTANCMYLSDGEIAYRDGTFPRGSELRHDEYGFYLTNVRRGRQSVKFVFACKPDKDGEWLSTRFALPLASVREVSVLCDRDDLEVVFPGALDEARGKNEQGETIVTAFIGITDNGFEMRWKPEIKKLEAEKVVECEVNAIATAGVNALHLDTMLNYKVAQGSIQKLVVAVSPDLNITQVRGEDIQDWTIEGQAGKEQMLTVSLSRPKDSAYMLQINGEMALPAFPCEFKLPSCAPGDVIRASGFLTVGTDSAIKIIVNKAAGLTQVDQAAFPKTGLSGQAGQGRALPARRPFTYQFANMPFTLALEADDIVTSISADNRFVLSIVDNDAVFNASVELDVRDAPARSVVFETDPDWIVAGVTGSEIADYDTRDENGRRLIRVHFRDAVLGRIVLALRMEYSLESNAVEVSTPRFRLVDAKAERGHVVMSGEQGLRVKLKESSGLIEVHTGSTPMRVQDAQLAFRFRDSEWSATLALERSNPIVHSEVFHLVALGDGALYGSALATYHISGAPTRELKFVIPPEYQNIEFSGRDVRNWETTNNLWTVLLQDKIMGDYTLLLSYEMPVNYAENEIAVGGVHTENTDSEVGYIVAASSAGLNVAELERGPSVIRIDRNEIPEAYALLVKDTVLANYKYVTKPHIAKLKVSRYDTEPLISQVADFMSVSTSLSQEGETVSTVTFFIKNASEQYLALALPDNAVLWSTRIVEPDGKTSDLQALQDKNGLLIPVPRPRDLNMPIQIEIVYAQNLQKTGLFRGKLRLEAPKVLKAPVPFIRWHVNLPEKTALAGIADNMAGSRPERMNGPGAVLAIVVKVYQALLQHAAVWSMLAVVVIGASCFAARRTGSRRAALTVLVAGGIALIVAAVFYLPTSLCAAKAVIKTFIAESSNLRQLSFMRSVSLPDSESTVLVLRLIPAWLGSSGSFWLFVCAGLAGLAAFLPSFAGSKYGLTIKIIGLTLLTIAVTQLALARTALALIIIVIIPALIAFVLISAALRVGRRRREKKLWAEGADLPPFQPEVQTPGGRRVDEDFAEAVKSNPSDSGETEEDNGESGGIRINALAFLMLSSLFFVVSMAAALPALPKGLIVQSIATDITVVEGEGNEEQQAQVVMDMEISAAHPANAVVIALDCVLVEFKPSVPKYMSIKSSPAGYLLEIARAGDYRAKLTFQAPVQEVNGQWRLDFDLPPHLENRATLKLPGSGQDIKSDGAVYLKINEADDMTEAVALFAPDSGVSFAWQPKMRKTELETTTFFSEMNSVLKFEPGVIDGLHMVYCRIAQGEIRDLEFSVPDNMNITSVGGAGISVWRFDPASRTLTVILGKPVSGSFSMTIVTQTPCDGLPYKATIGAPQIREAERQRGSIALAAPEAVQITVDQHDGLNAMNISDISPSIVSALKTPANVVIRRAFRYHQPPVSAVVNAEQVLPEIRVEENSSLSIADERVVLATRLQVAVAKAPVFSLRISIPDGFDVETISGEDISHWDEVKTPEREIIAHFNKPVMGTRDINIALARMEKGLESVITAPRVGVVNAFKHSGVLIVSAERGVRLTTIRREGVSELNPRDLGVSQSGALAFSLLRPQWIVVMKTEVLTPVIKPEFLHRVDLTEGMLKGRVYINYRIENAGCKVFTLQAPRPGTPLTFSGRDIAKVEMSDPAKGIWDITLHNKVEKDYSVTASYQTPFDPNAGEVVVEPLMPLNTEAPKGYLAVMSDGRVQVKPKEETAGLKNEDARGISSAFKAGDLSDAILCYRMIQPRSVLPLSVVRHESAASVPARVTETRIISTVSADGKMLARMKLQMNVGDMRFLKVELPHPEDRMWSAFVNGKVAEPERNGSVYNIPLEAVEIGESASVDFVFTGRARDGLLARELKGPKLDLPLTDILWTVYMMPNRFYYGFGGTLEHRNSTRRRQPFSLDAQDYWLNAARQAEAELEKAKSIMALGEEYARQGKQKLAKKSLESAITYSQSKVDFNEDARVQYHNLIQQQAVAGLVDRRNAVRQAQNIQTEQAQTSMQEDTSLRSVSEKILTQQEAAAGVAHAIHVTIPEHGVKLDFHRAMQVEPGAEMDIKFKSLSVAGVRRWLTPVFFIALFFAYRFCFIRFRAN